MEKKWRWLKCKWVKLHHEYTIFFVAIFVLAIIWLTKGKMDSDVISPESMMKIAMGVVATSILGGASWVWLNVVPQFKKNIDPDTKDYYEGLDKELTKWQKVLLKYMERFLSFLWYALFFLGGISAVRLF